FSYAIIDCLSAGVTLRYADSRLAEEASAAVFGADIAVYFEKNGISAGLSLNNLGTKVKYAETSYSQPMMLKVGAGYDLKLGSSALDFDAEADVLFAGGVMAGAGCEYSFKDMVFARAGYHFGSSANAVPSYASAGLGLKFFGAQLNFAYLFGSDVLSNSMCISLGYTF
ncbi:MAG: PorV/PorQ family protein, partial [Bacteroidales bacterium]|nr:PorV/PorQ family protein [Bacteroidales bacterium]